MTQSVRIFGDEIGKDEPYVDCPIDGIGYDGRIEMGDPDSDEVWLYSTDELKRLMDDGLLYYVDDIDTSAPVWTAIDELVKARDSTTLDDTSHFDEAIETLFRNAQ